MLDEVLDGMADRDYKLHWSVEQFMFREADLLDERRFREWLDLLHEDLEYQVPLRRNVHSRQMDRENTNAGVDVMWFDEDKETLRKRVIQLETGEHWAEEPISRVSHLVSNVRVVHVDDDSVQVTSRFLVYRNRVDTETDTLVGRRFDTLVRGAAGSWLLRKRVALIDQSVLMAKNLTVFL